MKAVHFGAGNIGRGFLGQLYWQSGYETVFIDIDRDLVRELNESGSYAIHVIGPGSYDVSIDRVRAVDARREELVAEEVSTCDIASMAVGAKAIPQVAELLAKGIQRRAERSPERPLNVIICENVLGAADMLRRLILAKVPSEQHGYVRRKVGLVESVVSRMVPLLTEEQRRSDRLAIHVEEYCVLPVDARGFVGEIPRIVGMQPTEKIEAFEERKLYTHNCGHALAAYFGFEKGCAYIWESMADEEVRQLVEKGLWESGEALVKKHGFTREEQSAHIDELLRRFANKPLGDTIARVARDPIRKLGPKDRLVGAARLAAEYKIEPRVLAKGIASALRYVDESDSSAVRLNNMLKHEGLEPVLERVCGIHKGERLYELIRQAYESRTFESKSTE